MLEVWPSSLRRRWTLAVLTALLAELVEGCRCALGADGGLECWGDDEYGLARSRQGPFEQVAAFRYCALHAESPRRLRPRR